jgi:pimeloyl-ACP methyl ester carboxylesterase
MPHARANGIQIEYETFGNPASRPLLLIMGLGAQMVLWEEAFCEELARQGHFVVRFDNRDVGLSTKLDEHGAPNVLELIQRSRAGEAVAAPYSLDDMADDAAGVLDAIGIDSAHVCGASMGGMIAQTLAIRHPARLRSLISIMSTTGNPTLPPPTPEAMAVLLTPPPSDRERNIERALATWKLIGSPSFPFDADRIRRRAARQYDRCFHPVGVSRQIAAIAAHGSRVEALRSVATPTLVIHGDADPLVPVEGGRDTARSVPGAELLLIEGMGHDLHPQIWPRLIRAVSDHTAKSNGGRRPASMAAPTRTAG